MAHAFINVKQIKEYCKKKNRRVGKDFLEAMSRSIESRLEAACNTHNGDKKTLDTTVAVYSGFKKLE